MGFWDSLGSKLSNANDSGTTSTGESTGKVFDTVASLVAPEKVRTQISGLFEP